MDEPGRGKQRRASEQEIDDQLQDSFPASDPPSYTARKRVGQPKREHRARTRGKKLPVESR